MQYRQLGFINKKAGGMGLTSDKKWLTNNLLDINSSSNDIFNAFTFLIDKGFVNTTERATAEARIYVGVQLTMKGIDMVEGIERGDDGKHEFNVTFNIKVPESMDVEALIAEHLSMLSDEN